MAKYEGRKIVKQYGGVKVITLDSEMQEILKVQKGDVVKVTIETIKPK